MAALQQTNSNSSSNYGEDVMRQANVLASCYLIDSAGSLKSFLYCSTAVTGLPSPPSSPPLAALTASNELVVYPKPKRSGKGSTATARRRGGATPPFRGECERFFCETLWTVFLGERDAASRGSDRTGVSYHQQQLHQQHSAVINGHGQLTPPDDSPFPLPLHGDYGGRPASAIDSWLHVYDHVGGTSFGAFVGTHDDGPEVERSLFVFIDEGVLGRDLKKGLVALIELAEGPLACTQVLACVERTMPEKEAKSLMKGLQWAGFSLTTLEYWASGSAEDVVDLTSPRWVFMGMEV